MQSATINQVRVFNVEGGQMGINVNADNGRVSYWFNTHRIKFNEFCKLAALKGVRI